MDKAGQSVSPFLRPILQDFFHFSILLMDPVKKYPSIDHFFIYFTGFTHKGGGWYEGTAMLDLVQEQAAS